MSYVENISVPLNIQRQISTLFLLQQLVLTIFYWKHGYITVYNLHTQLQDWETSYNHCTCISYLSVRITFKAIIQSTDRK